MAKRLTYESIKNYINNEETGNGCKILISEEEFELEKVTQNKNNSKVKLKIQCGCEDHNIFEPCFNKFKSNNQKQCQECGNKNTGNKLRKPYEKVKFFIETESKSNCKLKSKTYENAKENLDIECRCGTPFQTSFDCFSSGNKRQCDNCTSKMISQLYKIPYSDIKAYIEGENGNGCKLLTNEIDYINTNEDILIKCSCKKENKFITTYDRFKNQNKKQCDDCTKINKRKTCLLKYGFEHPMQNKEVSSKVRETLTKNGNVSCSKQQAYVHSIIGGELNYPYYNASLDIAFPEERIYCECDFGGHWLSIKLGGLTQDEFDKKERNRWYSLYRSGWKSINIISTKDLIPSDQKLLEIISYARTYLNQNHHYIKFDLDNSKIINSKGEFDYDFGELRRIKSTDIQIQEAI